MSGRCDWCGRWMEDYDDGPSLTYYEISKEDKFIKDDDFDGAFDEIIKKGDILPHYIWFCGHKCRSEYLEATENREYLLKKEQEWHEGICEEYKKQCHLENERDRKRSQEKAEAIREAREAKKAEAKSKEKARKVEKVKGVLAHIAAFVANLCAMQLFPSARGILFLYSIAFFISSWRTNRNDERNIYSLKHVLIWSAVGYIGATLLTIFL